MVILFEDIEEAELVRSYLQERSIFSIALKELDEGIRPSVLIITKNAKYPKKEQLPFLILYQPDPECPEPDPAQEKGFIDPFNEEFSSHADPFAERDAGLHEGKVCGSLFDIYRCIRCLQGETSYSDMEAPPSYGALKRKNAQAYSFQESETNELWDDPEIEILTLNCSNQSQSIKGLQGELTAKQMSDHRKLHVHSLKNDPEASLTVLLVSPSPERLKAWMTELARFPNEIIATDNIDTFWRARRKWLPSIILGDPSLNKRPDWQIAGDIETLSLEGHSPPPYWATLSPREVADPPEIVPFLDISLQFASKHLYGWAIREYFKEHQTPSRLSEFKALALDSICKTSDQLGYQRTVSEFEEGWRSFLESLRSSSRFEMQSQWDGSWQITLDAGSYAWERSTETFSYTGSVSWVIPNVMQAGYALYDEDICFIFRHAPLYHRPALVYQYRHSRIRELAS